MIERPDGDEPGQGNGRNERPRTSAPGDDESAAEQPGGQSVLETLGIDLTEQALAARELSLDGGLWENQIRRLKEILGRRFGHSAVLIGPEGVGKRALVAEVARHIAAGRVPGRLAGRRIIELPFHRVLAALRTAGDFEKIVFAALREAAARDDVLLFIDGITHFMGGVGRGENLTNAAYAIEMGCHQPGLYLIGSATPERLREASRTMPWCATLLTPVIVPEPKREAAVELLAIPASRLSEYHGVGIDREVIEAAVDLSNYYIRELVLPGKAESLIDRAASRAELRKAEGADPVAVTRGDVTEALSEWVGIPAGKLAGPGEGRELLGLEEALSRRIKGQDHCIRKLADVIRVAKLGLDARPGRPDGVFLFVGPPGVGKSELSRVLADELYGADAGLFEYNMARYGDDDALPRLIGLRVADVDYKGDLTTAVAAHPHCVVVLENIERSSSDVAVMLMQLFRHGTVRDASGADVSFSHATIIMTTNSENIRPAVPDEGSAVGFGAVDRADRDRDLEDVREAVERFFPPEFMDGVDEVLLFDHLTDSVLRDIVQLHLEDISQRLAGRSIELSVSESAVARLVEKGHSREYGARNLGRTVEGLVLKPLARFLLAHPAVDAVSVRTVEGDIEVGAS
ncbi:MAG: AAA domain-containing protein [Candidatus Eisenbacteria bacterium]|nr:AAA domain-containing protein [Candidatus Eisenbacteria bacterium]